MTKCHWVQLSGNRRLQGLCHPLGAPVLHSVLPGIGSDQSIQLPLLGPATQPPRLLDTSGSAGLLITDPQIAPIGLAELQQ